MTSKSGPPSTSSKRTRRTPTPASSRASLTAAAAGDSPTSTAPPSTVHPSSRSASMTSISRPASSTGRTAADGNSNSSCPTTARSRAICAAIPTPQPYGPESRLTWRERIGAAAHRREPASRRNVVDGPSATFLRGQWPVDHVRPAEAPRSKHILALGDHSDSRVPRRRLADRAEWPGCPALAVGQPGEEQRGTGDAGDRGADQYQRVEPEDRAGADQQGAQCLYLVGERVHQADGPQPVGHYRNGVEGARAEEQRHGDRLADAHQAVP